MKSYFLTLAFIVLISSTKAQTYYTPIYSQAIPTVAFHSLAGWHGGLQANALYNNFSIFSVNYLTNIDYFSPKIKAAFGMNANALNAFSGAMHEQFVQGYYAQRIKISKLTLTPSASLAIDRQVLRFDPFGNVTNADTLPITNQFHYLAVNVGLGAFFRSFYAAAQLSKINQPSFSTSASLILKYPMDFQMIAGWNRQFGNWTLSPGIRFFSQQQFTNYALSVNAMWKSINAGFRYDSSNQIALAAGYDLKSMVRLSYTYTRNVGYLSSYSSDGFHGLNLRIWFRKESRNSHKLIHNLGIL